MAKILDEFPVSRIGRPKGSIWDKYLDGQVWELVIEDFPTYKDLRSMRGGIGSVAQRKDIPLRTSIQEDKLYVQAKYTNESEGSKDNGQANS